MSDAEAASFLVCIAYVAAVFFTSHVLNRPLIAIGMLAAFPIAGVCVSVWTLAS